MTRLRFLLGLQTLDEKFGERPVRDARQSALSQTLCVSTNSILIC